MRDRRHLGGLPRYFTPAKKSSEVLDGFSDLCNAVRMVINGEYVLTEEDIRNQKARALLAHQEARENLDRLITEAHDAGKKHYRIARLLSDLEAETDSPATSEVPILSLAEMEYRDSLALATAKALANSIALARKELADAAETKRKVGCRE